MFNSEENWASIGVTTKGGEVYILETRPFTSTVHTGNRVLKISTDGKATAIASLENKNKSVNAANSSNNLLRAQEINHIGSDDANNAKLSFIRLGFYGIAGVSSVALFALVIFVLKKAN